MLVESLLTLVKKGTLRQPIFFVLILIFITSKLLSFQKSIHHHCILVFKNENYNSFTSSFLG
ncbi:hypothetical protein DC20_02100 [Rufibacter tibetensis]|uniref:Uncharacterized protein n=1 Tax=Rufibacter tibetensis TaxID=512763 RepID=A0A0P0CUF7_9BACT|nr:hypothetical protein DC20_02100 [Rufibacter tibetensis]